MEAAQLAAHPSGSPPLIPHGAPLCHWPACAASTHVAVMLLAGSCCSGFQTPTAAACFPASSVLNSTHSSLPLVRPSSQPAALLCLPKLVITLITDHRHCPCQVSADSTTLTCLPRTAAPLQPERQNLFSCPAPLHSTAHTHRPPTSLVGAGATLLANRTACAAACLHHTAAIVQAVPASSSLLARTAAKGQRVAARGSLPPPHCCPWQPPYLILAGIAYCLLRLNSARSPFLFLGPVCFV